ncbi:MAG: DUF1573 domain-containing protein [Candidatus Omnitrophica bacterium]|nr:DUF1573 domain-containing protein [Candidatus Omnitrophota bacterium]MBU1888642.1 DUF1573 domain-containing protein [Candidatus Omnitrophota bacterium]
MQFISILILIATYPLILFSQTNEELLETIIKGVSYNESFIQSATFELNFEKYHQTKKYNVEVIKDDIRRLGKEAGLRSEEIEKSLKEHIEALEKSEEDPWLSGSSRQVGKARFSIKDNRIRIDVEYTGILFKGPVDPHSDLEEEKYSEFPSRKYTYYYSPTDSYTFFHADKKLLVGEGPQRPFTFPLQFGLRWWWSDKKGVELLSENLQKLLKEGKLKLAGQEEVNDSMCYVLEASFPEYNSKAKWWIDPNKGYTVSKMINSVTLKQGDTKREFIGAECFYTVKNLTGDVWVPEEGVEKNYQFLDEFCEKLDKPYCKKVENLSMYVASEEHIKITNCVLNAVTDKDVGVPDIDSGEYKSIVDMKTGELIDVIPPNAGKEIDIKSPVVKLQIKGIVKEEEEPIKTRIVIFPTNIDFGDVMGEDINKGAFISKKTYIITPEDEEFIITNTESTSKYLFVQVSKNKKISYKGIEKNYQGFEVEVSLSPDIPVGKFEEKVTIYTTSEKYPKIEIPVTGNIKEEKMIESRPNMFFFGFVNKGETPASKMTIFTTGKEPLKIERIENPLDCISVAITPKTEDKEYEITATLKDNAPTGSIKGNITIHTNNPDQPKIEIPVYGLVKE